MEQIKRVAPSLPVRSAGVAARSGTVFTAPGDGATRSTAATGRTAAIVSPSALGAMLSVQEGAFETVRDRQARKRGHALLSALRAMQAGMIGSGGDLAGLCDLAALAADPPDADTPGLASVLGAIVLRARVELARHGG